MSNSKKIQHKQPITTTERYQLTGFFMLLAIFGLAAFVSTQQYLGMFFIAFVVTIVLYPVYKAIVKKIKIEMLASFTTMVIFIIILVIPITIILIIAINQGIELFTQLAQNFSLSETGEEIVTFLTDDIFPSIKEQQGFNLDQAIQNATLTIASWLTNTAMYIAGHGISMLIEFGIFLLFLTFFFPEKENILNALKYRMPLTEDESDFFVDRFAAITKKLSISIVVVPIVDGFLMWLILTLLNIPGAVFWGVITGIISLLPVVGVSLIWIPGTIILFIQGNYPQAIALGLYGLVVMNFADNIVRAWLLKGEQTQVPELVTLVSAIGGIFAFGFFGLFYGPIIVVTFLALLDIYKKRLNHAPIPQTPELPKKSKTT